MAGKQVIWSTEKVEEAILKLTTGYIPKRGESPFYENRVRHRRSNVVFAMTDLEEDEYIKCYIDVMYFAQNYCFVKTEDGKHRIIKLRPYQKEILKMYAENRFSILLSSRQSGKTISTAIFILHFILFNNQKNVLITANQWKTVYDVMDKIKEIYLNLPFFLQKGIVNWTQKGLLLDNKSLIRTDIMSKASGVGGTIDLLYSDEYDLPENSIQEKFYTAVYPTISSMDNSKIIITSTPRGQRLFWKLLINSERPVGDPLKNPYASMRVYWYAVPSRFCTYVRLNKDRLHELNLTKEEVFEYLRSLYGDKIETDTSVSGVELKYNTEINCDVIHVYNNANCEEEDIINIEYSGMNIREFSEITTWKKETIKAMGDEDAFNQEYGLQFVNTNRMLLSEKLMNELNNNKRDFKYIEIDKFVQKLRFSVLDLKWIDDQEIFNLANRKNEKIIMSLDISEGLGNDYTVINIFKISPKTSENIELYSSTFDKVSDFFCLKQIGMYRSNIISVAQLADLLYMICYDFFDPENVKIVLELNYGGPELLAYLPNVFDGNNSYGSSIFFRYKHRADSIEEKIGMKVTGTKNMLVKDYQDSLNRRDIFVYNEDNIRELTTFVKHETSAGNTTYKSDSSNDDTVMTVVNICTIFKKSYYISIVEDILRTCPLDFQNLVNTHLNGIDRSVGTDYKTFTNISRRVKNIRLNSSNKNNNFGY